MYNNQNENDKENKKLNNKNNLVSISDSTQEHSKRNYLEIANSVTLELTNKKTKNENLGTIQEYDFYKEKEFLEEAEEVRSTRKSDNNKSKNY